MTRNRKFPLGWLAFLLLAAGCAGPQRLTREEALAARHVYARPVEQVLPALEALLQGKGWQVAYRDRARLATEWREASGPMLPAGQSGTIQVERLVAEVVAQPAGGCTVRIMRQSRPWHRVALGQGDTMSMISSYDTKVYQGESSAEYLFTSKEEVGPVAPLRVSRALDLEWELLQKLEPDRAVGSGPPA